MERERDCEKCIHFLGGSCSKWSCEMETLEEHDQKVREEAIDDVYRVVINLSNEYGINGRILVNLVLSNLDNMKGH